MSEKLHYDSNDRDDGTLERCPFCDGEADLRIYEPPFSRRMYYVSCQSCGAMTKPAPHQEIAFALWKKRTSRKRLRLPSHGRWEINCDGYYPYCSECKQEPPGRVMTDWCPCCGAWMRGD